MTGENTNHNPPSSAADVPPGGSLYLALLGGGWVFVVGMALLGPWAVGTQVESRLVLAPGEGTDAPSPLSQALWPAVARALWGEPLGQANAVEVEPRRKELRWEQLSPDQQRRLMHSLGLTTAPEEFHLRWEPGSPRPELHVRMVLARPGMVPARLQNLLHGSAQQALAWCKEQLSRQLAAARAESRRHWQALLQTESHLRQWLQQMLGPQENVTPVAYWRHLPQGEPDADRAPRLVAPTPSDGQETAEGDTTDWDRLTIQQLQRRVAELEAQDQELAARLTELHPQRRQLQETLHRLRVYLARRLKQAGQHLVEQSQQAASPAAEEQPAQVQLARALQQHAQKLQEFQQELERLSQAYLQAAQREERLWAKWQELDRSQRIELAAPQAAPVWLKRWRNQLALLLVLAGGLVAVGLVRWRRWSLETFTSVEQMNRELGGPVVALAPWWYEAANPPRRRWRRRLLYLHRLLEGSLVALALAWASLAAVNTQFRTQLLQDPLLALACTWQYLGVG